MPEFLLLFTSLRHLNYFSECQCVSVCPLAITNFMFTEEPSSLEGKHGQNSCSWAQCEKKCIGRKVKWKLLSRVWLCNPMDCSPPGCSVHEILQARILEWVAIPFSRGSSQPRDWTQVFHIAGRFFTIWATREAHWEENIERNFRFNGRQRDSELILKKEWWPGVRRTKEAQMEELIKEKGTKRRGFNSINVIEQQVSTPLPRFKKDQRVKWKLGLK